MAYCSSRPRARRVTLRAQTDRPRLVERHSPELIAHYHSHDSLLGGDAQLSKKEQEEAWREYKAEQDAAAAAAAAAKAKAADTAKAGAKPKKAKKAKPKASKAKARSPPTKTSPKTKGATATVHKKCKQASPEKPRAGSPGKASRSPKQAAALGQPAVKKKLKKKKKKKKVPKVDRPSSLSHHCHSAVRNCLHDKPTTPFH